MVRRLDIQVASGDALDVRRFRAEERMNALFEISLVVLSDNPDIDLDGVVAQPAKFTVQRDDEALRSRTWTGLISRMEQVAVEEAGLSTYHLTLVPTFWLATQRRNYRMFQLQSEIDIVRKLLGEWGITFEERLSSTYKKRKYRVQYGESDFAFICRMLEDVGIAYYFEANEGATKLILHDSPQSNELRQPAIAFRDAPTDGDLEHVTAVRVSRAVRPGKYTMRDVDYRKPANFNLAASAKGAQGVEGVEEKLERFHYTPGAFLFETERGGDTPNADDRGKYRTDDAEAKKVAQKRIDAKRAIAKIVNFETNAVDPAPGVVVSFLDHPRSDLGAGKRLLVIAGHFNGSHDAEWTHACEAVSAEQPYRPPLDAKKPKAVGVESATVVGPAGEEIHVDEFGRVRVHFHWDRESKMDETSSCWIPVSQPWGGAGFGGSNLPRIGQEVIVDFLGGDPDRPVVIGRMYTNLQKTPYKLPDNKTQSGLKSASSPATGGYNEMMFEDAAGRELLRMQAERDLNKLVKHDEQVQIGNDRGKKVGRDDTHDVGRDRKRTVGNDESVDVGNDRTRTVGNDETLSVGNNRQRSVGANEEVSIASNQSLVVGSNKSAQVGGNESDDVSGNSSLNVGKNMSLKVKLAKNEMVGIASSESVGVAKTLQIGGSYSITAGMTMSTKVGQAQTENVGKSKTITVGEVFDITCGASAIHIDSGGNVSITATNISLKASGPILVSAGGTVEVEAAATVRVKGSTVDIN